MVFPPAPQIEQQGPGGERFTLDVTLLEELEPGQATALTQTGSPPAGSR